MVNPEKAKEKLRNGSDNDSRWQSIMNNAKRYARKLNINAEDLEHEDDGTE